MGLSFGEYMQLGKFVVDSLGGLGKGASEGRVAEGQLDVQRGQLAVNEQELALLGARYANDANMQRYIQELNRGKLELEQRQFQLTAPDIRMRQVMRGDLLANAKDVNLEMPSDVPEFNFTGGLKPSALGPNSRAFGRELSRQALLNQMPAGGGGTTGTGSLSALPSATASPATVAEAQSRINTRGSAQNYATDPGGIAGGTSAQVSTERTVPRGDVFAPLAPPPPVTGFGGPMGGSAGGPGGTTGESAQRREPGAGPGLARVGGVPRLRGIGGRGAEVDERGMSGYARAPGRGHLPGTGMSGSGDPRNGLGVMSLFNPAAGSLLLLDKILGGKILGPKAGAPDYGGIGPDTLWGPEEPRDEDPSRDNQFGGPEPTSQGFLDPNIAPIWGSPPRRRTGGGGGWFVPQM